MAKIRWSNHPTDKNLNGTEQHVPRSVSDYAVAVGQATVCIPARRGTNQWLAEMAEEEARRPVNPSDVIPINVWPPTWEVSQLPFSNKPVILFRHHNEVTRYEGVAPKGCPEQVRKDFEALLKATSPEMLEFLREKQAQENNKRLIHEQGVRAKVRAIINGF